MFIQKFLVCFLFCFMCACDDGAGYDRDASRGGSSNSDSCTTGSVYACVTQDDRNGFKYCNAQTNTFGACMIESTPASMATGGRTSSATTSISRGGVTSFATGGRTSIIVSTGGSIAIFYATGGATSIVTTTSVLVDMDGDGAYANASINRDCNDLDSRMSPYNKEICNNGIDDDCDAKGDCTDPDCTQLATCAYSTDDADGDGESAATDCNDQDASVYHGRIEVCWNGKDDDCDAMQDCTDPDCSC